VPRYAGRSYYYCGVRGVYRTISAICYVQACRCYLLYVGSSALYVPKFVPYRLLRLNEQQRRYAVTDPRGSIAMKQLSTLPQTTLTALKIDESTNESSLNDEAAGVTGTHKQASAEECVILLSDDTAAEQPQALSQKSRGHLERQDDLKV